MKKNRRKLILLLAVVLVLAAFLLSPEMPGRKSAQKKESLPVFSEPRTGKMLIEKNSRNAASAKAPSEKSASALSGEPGASADSRTEKQDGKSSGGKGTSALTLRESTGRRTRISFQMPEFSFGEEIRYGRKMLKIHCPEAGGMSLRRGAPELPVFSAELAVVAGRNYSLRMENPVWEEKSCLPPVPANGMRKRKKRLPPAEPDPKIYQGTAPYPEHMAQKRGTGAFRGVGACRVMLMPMQYLPDRKVMRICRSCELILEDTALPEQTALPPLDGHGDFAVLQRRTFMNSGRMTVRSSSIPAENQAHPGHLLLVFPDGWKPSVDVFSRWKKQLGFSVQEAAYGTPSLKSPGQLRRLIAENKNLTHVILLGDGEAVPPFQGITGREPQELYEIVSDIPYVLLDGPQDMHPDVFISRITSSFEADLKDVLEKLCFGEVAVQTVAQTDDWRKRAAFMGSDEGDESRDWEVMEAERSRLIQAGVFSEESHRLYDQPTKDVVSAQVTEVLQAGTPYFAYLGHGNYTFWQTGFFNADDVWELTNSRRLPLIVSPVCDNGMFMNPDEDCLAEAFLENPFGGALAFIGSTCSTDWDPPIYMVREMSRILIQNQQRSPDRLRTLGAWYYSGVQMGVMESQKAQCWDEADRFLFQMHLFGDCTQLPRAQSVTGAQVQFQLLDTGISGQVQDAEGKSCSGVRMVFSNQEGIRRSVFTDAAGKFSFSAEHLLSNFNGLLLADSLLEFWQSRKHRLNVRYGSTSGAYWSGQKITVRSDEPAAGRKFLYWRCSRPELLTVAQREKAVLELVMPDQDLELTAVMGLAGNP